MKKRILSAVIAACLVLALTPAGVLATGYNDTDNHWAKDEIARWSGYGVVEGKGDSIFDPDGNMTRGEAAQVFANLLNLTDKADLSAFTDVGQGQWYDDAIAQNVAAGIMNGVGDNSIDPNGTITREMVFTMFARALGINEEEAINKTMTDSDDVSSWAKGYVNALVNHGYVLGLTETTIGAGEEINRASMMALLDQSIVAYANTDEATIEANENGIVIVVADDVKVTGTGNLVVIIAVEDANVDLAGITGTVTVLVNADNATITNASVGTVITTAKEVTGTTVDGTALDKDVTTTIGEVDNGEGGGEVDDSTVILSTTNENLNIVQSGNTYTVTGTLVSPWVDPDYFAPASEGRSDLVQLILEDVLTANKTVTVVQKNPVLEIMYNDTLTGDAQTIAQIDGVWTKTKSYTIGEEADSYVFALQEGEGTVTITVDDTLYTINYNFTCVK